MSNGVFRFIVMLVILAAGMGCIIYAKLSFAKRQRTNPDNKWNKQENTWRYFWYALCILDVIIAGFFN